MNFFGLKVYIIMIMIKVCPFYSSVFNQQFILIGKKNINEIVRSIFLHVFQNVMFSLGEKSRSLTEIYCKRVDFFSNTNTMSKDNNWDWVQNLIDNRLKTLFIFFVMNSMTYLCQIYYEWRWTTVSFFWYLLFHVLFLFDNRWL